jgi:hypothetical protein
VLIQKRQAHCGALAGWPRACDRPNFRAVRCPRPLRPVAGRRRQRQSASAASPAGQRRQRKCGRAATGVIGQAAAQLAADRHRRSGPLPTLSGGRLIRGHRGRSQRRHVHVALARLPAGPSVWRHRLRLALLYPGPKPGGVAALRNRTRQSSLATVKNALINDPSFEELLRPGANYI